MRPKPSGSPRAALVIGALLLLSSAYACHAGASRGDPALQMRVSVDPTSPKVGSARLVVTVGTTAWSLINGAKVTVTAIPPDSTPPPAPVRAVGQGAGRYVVRAYHFDRPGTWTLTARADFQGRWKEVDQQVSVVPDSAG